MTVPSFTQFISECIVEAPDRQPGLLEDEVYGVYVSWCFLNGERPASDEALWSALEELGYSKHGSSARRYPGLAVRGPAVLDYILSSRPSLV